MSSREDMKLDFQVVQVLFKERLVDGLPTQSTQTDLKICIRKTGQAVG
jgi:hypothetical protein